METQLIPKRLFAPDGGMAALSTGGMSCQGNKRGDCRSNRLFTFVAIGPDALTAHPLPCHRQSPGLSLAPDQSGAPADQNNLQLASRFG